MKPTTTGTGAVLPAGSAPATAALPKGNFTVIIEGFGEGGLLRCVYPGGFVKHHQAGTVEELAGKVVNQIRGRFGAGEVKFEDVPTALEAGQSFVVEV